MSEDDNLFSIPEDELRALRERIAQLRRSDKFSPEQEEAVSRARDKAIAWLNKRHFGALNYTPAQQRDLDAALVDVAPVLEAGEANISRLADSLNYPYDVRFTGKAGSGIFLDASDKNLRFQLHKPSAKARGVSILKSLHDPDSPFDEESLLLDFWIFDAPHEPFEDIDSWVKRLYEGEGRTKQSIVTRLMPAGIALERKIVSYRTYWTSDQFIDLVIRSSPESKYEAVDVLRRFPTQRDGSIVFASRANFGKDNRPQPAQARPVFQGKLALNPVKF